MKDDVLARGRRAFQTGSWQRAYAELSAADEAGSLGIDDLERFALTSYILGKEYDCARLWTRAHHECIRKNDARRAARCAFWQACGLLFKGEMAPAMGWIARGRRILDDFTEDCPERAWLLVLTGLPMMFQGDAAAALPYFIEAEEIAARFVDPDVQTFARLTHGHSLILVNEMSDGLALFDEVMVAVTSGELNPLLAGIVYCQVIATCQDIFDLRRAREWTAALSRWCDSQPDLVPYRGNCLVHRCEILELQGSWPQAQEAAEQACETFAAQRAWEMLGSARYRLAEIHRLHGALDEARSSFGRASEAGRDPEPGMSLLLLAEGRLDVAAASIRRVVDEAQLGPGRARVLPAYVEIMLATGDLDAARIAADELASITASVDTAFVRALSAHATGATLLAEGNANAALETLRDALRAWQEIDAPYEAARVQVLMAGARLALGDQDASKRDIAAARSVFVQLGATTDIASVDKLSRDHPGNPGGLSPREVQVLALLARGKTNREISSELVLSEHTVARHVQNILGKLGVSSRTAASAFAFEHDLIQRDAG